jgi:xanthine dehydrogenase accessory factor
MENIYTKILELERIGQRAALCVVTATSGSSPRKAGAKMVITEKKEIFGTVGGGAIELEVTERALEVIKNGQPSVFAFNLANDLAMHCGGKMDVYIEPLVPGYELTIFGAGHIGAYLAHIAPDFGFRVTLVDPRTELTRPLEGKGINIISENFAEAARKLKTNQSSCLLAVSPQHSFDHEITAILGQKPFLYLGMIGSKTKVAQAKKYFTENNLLTEEQISKIDMPVGIKFKAETPQEIAISILAKLIDVKNSR